MSAFTSKLNLHAEYTDTGNIYTSHKKFSSISSSYHAGSMHLE